MKELTPEEQERYERLYSATYNKYIQMPKEYFPHDSDAHRDDALRRLVLKHGMSFYGRYWLLIELLTAKKGHMYDISDDIGINVLTLDMSVLEPISREDLMSFVRELGDAGLLCQELLGEGKVSSERVSRNIVMAAEVAAAKSAGGSLGGGRSKRD